MVAAATAALFGLAAVLMVSLNFGCGAAPSQEPSAVEPLVFHCAAGIKPPVEAAARQYEDEYGVPIQLNFGGSGALLSTLTLSTHGDIYLAADASYLEIAAEKGLVQEIIPLARIRPVIAVRKGNKKEIKSLADLLRDDVKLAIANPDAASIGKQVRKILQASGQWADIEQAATGRGVFKPTVTDIANDVKMGAMDAALVWDCTAEQYPELEAVHVPEFDAKVFQITLGILKSCKNPAAALRFARYLAASDRGLLKFAELGYEPVDGDVWDEQPEIVLFSGGVNRLAIQDTIAAFEKREGATVTTNYNGCGILVGMMKGGRRPDAYFACDPSFMIQVQDLFLDATTISETDMVILTRKGNPYEISSLQDLADNDIKLGVANPQQSALGALTERLLQAIDMKLYDGVMKNVRAQTPTADLLVGQVVAGALDAAIVYEANTANVRDKDEVVRIDHAMAKAVQPFAIGKQSQKKYLTARLLAAIRSAEGRKRFTDVGFRLAPQQVKP